MGGTSSKLVSEDVLDEYVQLTYLSRVEILKILKRFHSIDPRGVESSLMYRINAHDIMRTFLELKCNPYRDRLLEVFSSYNDSHMSFEDMLDLFSALSENCPDNVKARWAFKIFDFDDDNLLSVDDLKHIVGRLCESRSSKQRWFSGENDNRTSIKEHPRFLTAEEKTMFATKLHGSNTRCNRPGVNLFLISLSQATLELVQSNLAPRLWHRQRCNRSGVTLFLYAPEIFWSSRTAERKWMLCVLVTALRSVGEWTDVAAKLFTLLKPSLQMEMIDLQEDICLDMYKTTSTEEFWANLIQHFDWKTQNILIAAGVFKLAELLLVTERLDLRKDRERVQGRATRQKVPQYNPQGQGSHRLIPGQQSRRYREERSAAH
uniref:EF-hand domain-containing protein n=1 Tax=Timema bartmani TaxID=61472 RepID=A0A7R9EWA1_9NEOP|nr:unnamed protein product [Timema bartmani]